ncbi:MAG: threonine-phosphate decarboxylase CobD [Eubacteriales bacterium]|jgi:threonine-phosphate decarboxylase
MMERYGHGGDVYGTNRGLLDFSANINPLGMPAGVREAIARSAAEADIYPDPFCRQLRQALGEAEGVPSQWILCGNGAADLIFRLARAMAPGRGMVTAPAFSEYEKAMTGAGWQVRQHELKREDGFTLTAGILEELRGIRMLFLCNPANPTGSLTSRTLLLEIARRCQATGTILVVDECFHDFVEDSQSMVPYLGEFPGMVVLRAFTKIYAMAGVRLGYCLCSDPQLLEAVAEAGQPWGVSTLAQAAGLAALRETDYVCRSRKLVREQRARLMEGLRKAGMEVLPGAANYLFFRSPRSDLGEKLRQTGILVRSCANYQGLDERDWRIAVRGPEENGRLLAALERIQEA